MVLLTSSQVSLAVSSTIVFLFTSALFLAGYTIQQNTVKSLQIAIKPAPRTAHEYVYLPPAFANKDPDVEHDSVTIPKSQSDPENVPDSATEDAQKPALFAEILKGVADIHAKSTEQKPLVDSSGEAPTFEEKNRRGSEGKVEEPQKLSKEEEEWQKLSKAERRRRIKMDIEEMTAEDRTGYKRRQW